MRFSLSAGPDATGPDGRVQAILSQHINHALAKRPGRFDRRPRAHGFSEDQLPIWCTPHTGSYIRGVQEGKGAALLAWLRTWVRPVMVELARDDAAKSILLENLPPAPKEVNEKSDFDPPIDTQEKWEEEFDGPAVHLWSLWYRWQKITCLSGEKFQPLSPPPLYPGLSSLPRGLGLSDLNTHTAGRITMGPVLAKDPHARAFLRSVTKALQPTDDLAVNAEKWTGLLCDALCWLRDAVGQQRKQPKATPRNLLDCGAAVHKRIAQRVWSFIKEGWVLTVEGIFNSLTKRP